MPAEITIVYGYDPYRLQRRAAAVAQESDAYLHDHDIGNMRLYNFHQWFVVGMLLVLGLQLLVLFWTTNAFLLVANTLGCGYLWHLYRPRVTLQPNHLFGVNIPRELLTKPNDAVVLYQLLKHGIKPNIDDLREFIPTDIRIKTLWCAE